MQQFYMLRPNNRVVAEGGREPTHAVDLPEQARNGLVVEEVAEPVPEPEWTADAPSTRLVPIDRAVRCHIWPYPNFAKLQL